MKQPLVVLFVAVQLLSACSSGDPQSQLTSAKQYLLNDDEKSALIEVKAALQGEPDLAEARFVLGKLLLSSGNVGAAEIELKKALDFGHLEDDVIPELATAVLLTGDRARVIREFSDYRLGRAESRASLQRTLALAHLASGKAESAEAALVLALEAVPEYAPALLVRARVQASKQHVDDALLLVERVIAKDAQNADAWQLKGDLLFHGKQTPDVALGAYEKAVAAKPKAAAHLASLISTLVHLGQFAPAEARMKELRALSPNSFTTKYLETRFAYLKKDYVAARDFYQQLLRISPNNARALLMGAAVEFQLKRYPQSILYASNAIQAEPGLAPAHHLLIESYLRSGYPSKALEVLNAVIDKDRMHSGLLTLAGEVYLRNNQLEQAERALALALKDDPNDATKRTALAVAKLAGGKVGAALDDLESIASSDNGMAADLALINAYLRQKHYDKALVAVDRLDAKKHDLPMAAHLRGRIQLARRDTASARKSFEQALAIAPEHFESAASLAALDLAEGSVENAKGRFERQLKLNPGNAQALLSLAQLAAQTGAPSDDVATLLTRAAQASPNEVVPHLLLVDLYLERKDLSRAMSAARAGVGALPDSPELLDALGRVQQASGELNQALSTYAQLATAQPQATSPHLRLAALHILDKNQEAAAKSLQRALEIKPDLLEAQSGLFLLALESKRFADARKIAATIQLQRPDAAVGYSLAANVELAEQRFDVAEEVYRQGLGATSSGALASELHALMSHRKKTGQAYEFAAKWLKTNPKDTAFRSYLGSEAIKRKDFAAAERIYRGVIQIDPNDAPALNNLAWAVGKQGKPDAIGFAERATRLAPSQAAYLDTLSTLLSASGDHTRAIAVQVRALKLQPTNPEIRLSLAKIYLGAGQRDDARKELKALLALGDNLPQRVEVEALLRGI